MTTASYSPPPFPCSIIVVQKSGRQGKTFKFERKDWCIMGANQDCDIIVPFPDVAQLQALIHVKKKGVFIQGIDKHLPVTHSRLHKHLINEEEFLLLPGDEFLLGERKFLIEYNAEDANIKGSDANVARVQGPSTSEISSKCPRTATPRSRTVRKNRRKSSLVVGEFDETYVSPRRGSDKLLSKAQLARVSPSEFDTLSDSQSDRSADNQESSSPQMGSEEYSQSTEHSSSSSTSDESTMLSDHHDSVSRNINFSAIETDPFSIAKIGDERDTEPHKKVPLRTRKELVFTRLSKGLSATPRRREKVAVIGRTKNSGFSQFEESKFLTGKENVPQPCQHGSKSFKPKDMQEDQDFNRIRSPLVNRTELENRVDPDLDQKGVPLSRRRTRVIGPTNHSAQTPRGRSVAFANAIELAAGSHYSPYRPKHVPTVSRRTVQSVGEEQSEIFSESVRTRRLPNRFPIESPSLKQNYYSSADGNEQGSAPASSSEQLGSVFYSKQVPRDELQHRVQPVVEYEDDSDPPTPSSDEQEADSTVPQVSGPSPMARVGGALSAFLKRLSGTLESDEDDASSGRDEAASHKRISFGNPQKNEPRKVMPSTEPAMSSSDLIGLSRCLSPKQRNELVAKVEDAAKDMRQAMHPTSEELTEELSYPSEKNLENDEVTLAELGKNEDGSAIAKHNRVQHVLEASDPGSDNAATCDDRRNSPIRTASLGYHSGGNDEKDLAFVSDDNSSRDLLVRPGCIAPESDTEEELMEQLSDGTNDTGRADLTFEEIEGDGKDENDTEGSDHKIAAIVNECRGENLNSPFRSDSCNFTGAMEAQHLGMKTPMRHEDVMEPGRADQPLSTDVLPGPKRDTAPGAPVDEQYCPGNDKPIADAVAKVCVKPKPDDIKEDNINKDDQDSVPSGTSELDKKPTVATLRKELSRLKKDELKEMLIQHELDVNGLKKDLVERLALHMIEGTSPAASLLVTTRMLQSCQETAGADSSEMGTHTVARRSARKSRSQAPLEKEVATSSGAGTSEFDEALSKVESDATQDLSLYRRRTVKELRQFLKDRGLDVEQRMRKEELIQHLVSLSIGSDGHDLAAIADREALKSIVDQNTNSSEPNKSLSTSMQKPHHKMTAVQLRAELKERGQCQVGTKKVLLERLTMRPERRTRSRRIADATSCVACQSGKICEAEE